LLSVSDCFISVGRYGFNGENNECLCNRGNTSLAGIKYPSGTGCISSDIGILLHVDHDEKNERPGDKIPDMSDNPHLYC
jgi:hypothetical protein